MDVPVIPIGHLSAAELRAFALADNKIASLAGWDDDILRIEFEELQTACNFELEITGFSTTEIDLLSEAPRPEDKLENVPDLGRREAVGVETGDLWLLGKHKLLCGDSRDPGCFAALSQHELVFVWKCGTAPHLNTVELGKNGRYRTNVWNYRGASKTGSNPELAMHPTVKPVPMIIDAIKDTSKRGEIVLDPFGGSGSTLIAAHKAGRHARLIEYEPHYCEVTIRRWQDLTGSEATLAASGETFAEVHRRRNDDLNRLCELALEEPSTEEAA